MFTNSYILKNPFHFFRIPYIIKQRCKHERVYEMRYGKTGAVLLALAAVLMMTGCGEEKQESTMIQTAAQAVQSKVAAERAAQQAEQREEENQGTKLDFGGKTAFGGIEVETDENGELVMSEEDSAVWFKITDKRFKTFKKFKQFTTKKVSSDFYQQVNPYFSFKDGAFYFVVGINGRGVESFKKYYFNDYDGEGGSKITVNSTHSTASSKKYGVYRSTAAFVRHDGVWKLDSLTLYNS